MVDQNIDDVVYDDESEQDQDDEEEEQDQDDEEEQQQQHQQQFDYHDLSAVVNVEARISSDDYKYIDYRPSTIDPGPWPFVTSISLCVVLILVLPLCLSLRRRRRCRKEKQKEEAVSGNGVDTANNNNTRTAAGLPKGSRDDNDVATDDDDDDDDDKSAISIEVLCFLSKKDDDGAISAQVVPVISPVESSTHTIHRQKQQQQQQLDHNSHSQTTNSPIDGSSDNDDDVGVNLNNPSTTTTTTTTSTTMKVTGTCTRQILLGKVTARGATPPPPSVLDDDEMDVDYVIMPNDDDEGVVQSESKQPKITETTAPGGTQQNSGNGVDNDDTDDDSSCSDRSDNTDTTDFEWTFLPLLNDFQTLMNGDEDDDDASDMSSVITDDQSDDESGAGWMLRWNACGEFPDITTLMGLDEEMPTTGTTQQEQQQQQYDDGHRSSAKEQLISHDDEQQQHPSPPMEEITRHEDPEAKTKDGNKQDDRPSQTSDPPWCCFYCSRRFWRTVRKCATWDDEMGRILRLALPYTAHTILANVFGLLEIGLIGRALSSTELSAYFAVQFAINLATMFLHGIMSSLTVLVSHAIGADNLKLAGKYVQLSLWTHQVCFIPIMIVSWTRFDQIVLLLGFDDDTANAAEDYARFVLMKEALVVYDDAIHYVLSVSGNETYSAIVKGVYFMTKFVAVYSVCSVDQQIVELWTIGAIHLSMTITFFLINATIVVWNGWFEGMWRGMLGSNPFEDVQAIKTFFRASLPLSCGYVVENCEWTILFLFAAQQGRAEVAVWGLVGALWKAAGEVIMAICKASRVRVARLLGSGRPDLAKHSAQKSFFWVTVFALVMSSIIYALELEISEWLTNDETLQEMFRRLMPLAALGVLLLSMGTMTWSIMCAQGRGPLATAVTGLGNILVTLPLAAVSTFFFDFNLRALVACIIVGGCLSDFFNAMFVLTSNWKKISATVTERSKKRSKKKKKKKKRMATKSKNWPNKNQSSDDKTIDTSSTRQS